MSVDGLSGRPMARSLITPASLIGYRDIIGETFHSGFVELCPKGEREFVKKWMKIEDAKISFSNSPVGFSDVLVIDMDSVVSFKTDINSDTTFSIRTLQKDLLIRVKDKEERDLWLFSMQKTIATVLTHILDSRNRVAAQGYNMGTSYGESNLDLIRQPSHHNDFTNMYRRHGQIAEVGGASHRAAQSYTGDALSRMEFGFLSPNSARATVARDIDWETPSYQMSTSLGRPQNLVAISPAVRIVSSHSQSIEDSAVPYGRSAGMASSFHESTQGVSPLMGNSEWTHEDESDSDVSVDLQSVGSACSDDDVNSLMWELEVEDDSDKSEQPDSSAHNQGSASSATRPSPSSLSKDSRKFPRWRTGHVSRMGPRNRNEDRFVAIANIFEKNSSSRSLNESASSMGRSLNGGLATSLSARPSGLEVQRHHCGGGSEKSSGYFAVYDGHAGESAATYLQENLLDRITSHASFSESVETAIFEACVEFDKEYLAIAKETNCPSGSTAVGAMIIGTRMYVFNIGDSSAVLCSKGKAIELCVAHKPCREDEAARIKAINGWITEERELYMARLHQMDLSDPVAFTRAQNMSFVSVYRVCGELSVTRSIGDPDYKGFVPGKHVDAYFCWPEQHTEIFDGDLVIPNPEIRMHTLSTDDEFLIVASDGIWDVISPDEATAQVSKFLAIGKNVFEAAEELADMALRLGSSDNVTVIITQFLHV